MKQAKQLAIFCLILISTLSTITCFNTEIKVDSLNKLDPNSKYNGFQNINTALTGDEGVLVDIDDSTVYRDQINYQKTPNIWSDARQDFIYQLSRDIEIDKPMARISFKLDLPYSYVFGYRYRHHFVKVALLFGNNETEIGFGFYGKRDYNRYSYNEYFENTITGTVFNVPIGVHPIKFKLTTTSNSYWQVGRIWSNGSWGRQYPMMDVEGEILKPAKKDKKAKIIIPKDETSMARPNKQGRYISTNAYYTYPYSYTWNPKTKGWRFQFRTPWAMWHYAWAYWGSPWYRKLQFHDATVGETFAYPVYNQWGNQAATKGTLSFYDSEGWWGFKHTDKEWNGNQGLNVSSYNQNSWYKLQPAWDNNWYQQNKTWKKYANMTESKWLTYKHYYRHWFYIMYTIPKVEQKSAIYFATEYESTVKIKAKGKTFTTKKANRQNVTFIKESQYKKKLKSKDEIVFEVDSGKKNAYITALINYKDSNGIVRLLSADKFMICDKKTQRQKKIHTIYSNINNAPMITLLSGKAQFYVGQEKTKIKCTVKLP